MRHFTYRAIAGVSMGGFGSSVNFWRHPERYDAIGVMGADPGPDLTYTLGMIHDFFFSRLLHRRRRRRQDRPAVPAHAQAA